jgi:hypothetical protein
LVTRCDQRFDLVGGFFDDEDVFVAVRRRVVRPADFRAAFRRSAIFHSIGSQDENDGKYAGFLDQRAGTPQARGR